MITLYAKDGLQVKAEIKKYSYHGTFLGECFINTTIESPTPINFEIGDYLMFRGERFELNYIPAKEKQSSVNSISNAFIYDNIKFNSLADELTRVEFLDMVMYDNEVHGSSLPNFSFMCRDMSDLVNRLQANLDRVFTGDKKWTIHISPNLETPEKPITVSKISVWEALQLVNTELKANFIIRNRTITIGTSGYAVGAVFGYGKGNGLYDIQQSTNQDAKIITRLHAFGSTRNIPLRYYNNLKDGGGNPYIQAGVYVPNLMLPDFPKVQSDPSKIFIDSDAIAEYGIREGSVYFDGSDEDNEIYPSLEGMTSTHLQNAGISVSLPVGDNGNIDEILGAINPIDDGLIPEESSGQSIESYFTVYLKDLGFDLSERDADGQYKYATVDTMQISMKTGMNAGRTFDVLEDGITKDTSLGYTRYKIECRRFEDDSIQGGTAFPNSQHQLTAGDKFVILGIAMPDVYIQAASQRLLEAAQEYLSQNDKTQYTYTPKIDELFMARNPHIGDGIKEGDLFNFNDTDLEIDDSVIIQNLTINYNLDSSPIPTYEVSLSNDRIATRIDKMQNTINSLQSNAVGLSIDSIKALINSIGGSLFLSKNFNDSAKGLIKFIKGLDVGEFSSGAFGGGGTFRMKDGDSYLEVDRLVVRKLAHFFEVLIERMSHIGGSQVLSLARMICSKVEELPSAYRCYFDTGDNNEFVQEFAVGDQARCQVFTGSTQKYYWRLVTAIGTDYIEVSKTDCDSGSAIPAIGDHIFQLGHRTDRTRQNAQILSSFGQDAPSFKQYDGINSYTLEGRERTVLSPHGNKLEGEVTIKAGSSGWENLSGLPERFDGLMAGAVNLIRNSGFTGDYASKQLKPNTKLEPTTDLYSDALGMWEGSATVNNDSGSFSGYSATLLDQTLSQTVPIIFTENYVLSFKAKGQFVNVSVGGSNATKQLSNQYERYVIKLEAGDSKIFSIGGRCTVCEIQLERGTIGSEYNFSPLDNDKTLAKFEAMRYISDSVKNGSTSILGGLILSSLIQVGNYINGEMKEVTAGMSGMYNNDKDVAFWAGGDLFKALATSLDPQITDPEKLANFVVTHGGKLIANEAIIRGHITATSGTIGGFEISEDRLSSVKTDANGKPFIELDGVDGSGWLAGGNLLWDAIGQLKVNGVFKSIDNDGNSILLDIKNKAIQMIDSNGNIFASIGYNDSIDERSGKINLNWYYYPDGEGQGIFQGSVHLDRMSGLKIRNHEGNEVCGLDPNFGLKLSGYFGQYYPSLAGTGHTYVENGFLKVM